jgi:hypothetical protein
VRGGRSARQGSSSLLADPEADPDGMGPAAQPAIRIARSVYRGRDARRT